VTPVLLVPGLLCSSEIFAAQIPALWRFGPVTVASTLEGERIDEAAAGNATDADLDTPGRPFAVAAHLNGRPRLVRNPRLRPWNMIEASLQ
jgi:hypothetical protein